MKDLFELCGECRHLSDAEVIYQLTNNKETTKNVSQSLQQGDNVTIEDVCNQLTPARKAMALAVIELYKRLSERKTERKQMKGSKEVFEAMKPILSDLHVEESWIILLDAAAHSICKQRISVGGLSATQVDCRVILALALKYHAVSMILVHNHPSGSSRPSQDDQRLTKALYQAGQIMNIKLLDHVIFAGDDYFSFADEGQL